jgi:hypothetical protein
VTGCTEHAHGTWGLAETFDKICPVYLTAGAVQRYQPVPLDVWQAALRAARKARPLTAESCLPEDVSEESTCYLHTDHLSGFAVLDGYLTGVFSAERGRGDDLMRAAIAYGADELECHGTYLTRFYARHGFVVVSRERGTISMRRHT